jgi:phosphate transport system protein
MPASAIGATDVYHDALTNYLVSMARAVELSVNRALDAMLTLDPRLARAIFLNEPRLNEMEIIIDEHAVKLLRRKDLAEAAFAEEDIRQIVATLKVNNDLERMGDLAVSLGQRALSLSAMHVVEMPQELEPMVTAVRAMVTKSLGTLIYRNVDLAQEVLQSDAEVDDYRDRLFETIAGSMAERPLAIAASVQVLLATRHLERIGDHCTNIAEDIFFWVRGLDVRHGRALQTAQDTTKKL